MAETLDTAMSHWGSGIRRRNRRPGTLAWLGSLVLHGGVVAAMWVSGTQLQREMPKFVQYRVRIYSPPPTELGPPTPVEQTTAAVSTPMQPDVKTATPTPTKPKTQAPLPKQVQSKTKDAKPATGPNPKPGAVGGEGIDIAMEGQEFPYPEYLANIQVTLYRYFRWSGAPNLSADVVFYIKRDGSVGGIDVVRGSGNFRFDLQVHEAVEQAGRAKAFGPLPGNWQRAKAFGPLPGNWQGDKLYIMNTFAPQR